MCVCVCVFGWCMGRGRRGGGSFEGASTTLRWTWHILDYQWPFLTVSHPGEVASFQSSLLYYKINNEGKVETAWAGVSGIDALLSSLMYTTVNDTMGHFCTHWHSFQPWNSLECRYQSRPPKLGCRERGWGCSYINPRNLYAMVSNSPNASWLLKLRELVAFSR